MKSTEGHSQSTLVQTTRHQDPNVSEEKEARALETAAVGYVCDPWDTRDMPHVRSKLMFLPLYFSN